MTTSQASGDRREEERVLVCDQCGTRQDPGHTFCESCNAVLHWNPGTSAATPSGQTPSGQTPSGQAASGPVAHREAAVSAPGTGTAPGDGGHEGASRVAPGDGGHDAAPGATGTSVRLGASSGDGGYDGGEPAASGDSQNDDTMDIAVVTRPPESASQAAPPVPVPDPAGAGTGSAPYDPSGTRQPLPDTDSTADRARALLVPVADPQGEPDRPPSVVPVLPGRPAPARPEVRSLGEQEIHGGIACPWCGTANRPDRHFCCRCAMSMAADPDNGMRRRSWWRRMLDYRNREVPWAGDRPRLRRQLGRILRWVAWAAVLALVVTGLFHVDGGVQAIRDHFAKRVSVVPVTVKASRSFAKHGANRAFDKVSNTWWGPGVAESGQGQWLEAHFQEPVTLLAVGITSGESTHADTLSKSALPQRIEASITMDDGKVVTKELVLDQASGFQQRDFRFHDVRTVRFTLETAYNTSDKKQVAIAEIEFFGPSQGGNA